EVDGTATYDFTAFFHLFEQLSRTMYIGAFRNVVPAGGDEHYYDMAIGQPFINQWRHWRNGKDRRRNQRMHSVTKHIQDVFRLKQFEISSGDGPELLVTIDDQPARVSEVGSGLAQFIVAFANAAMFEPSYICIDEPELHLHPRLQLDFLTGLGRYASDGV